MKDLKSLLDLMFLPDDTVCPSVGVWAYHSVPVKEMLTGKVTLVSPNPKVKTRIVDIKNITLLALNPVKGFRNDDNAYRLQTFLWEIDVGSLKSQFDYIKKLGLPTSAAIYSGNKSIHFITVLDQTLELKEYRNIFRWVRNIAPLLDKSCINPTRAVRLPGAIRPDTGKEQRLIEIKGVVKLDDFMDWLNKYEELRPKERERTKNLTNEDSYDNLSKWAKSQFKDGIDFSRGRNVTWFNLACDLFDSGYNEDDATVILNNYFVEENDFKEKEFLMAISSAYKHMSSKG